jgi:DNA polymerase-3 subunit epsilon
MHFVIVDIETTGGSPKSSKITEIAMYKHDGFQIIDEFVTLVNPEIPIPEFIVRLTGISDKMVENAPKFYEIAKKIIEFSENCVFVAHNVGFDYGIVRHEFNSLGYDYRRSHICTVRASRYIIPGHDSYSLGKLTRALGIELIGRHRAGGDAHATALLFQLLYQKSEKNVLSFLQEELNPKSLHPNLDIQSLDEIPNKTGIYKFYDDANRIIYIGKSKHIRKRIDQHLKNVKTKKGIEMMTEICRVEFELTGSELIALLYESNLIKKHKPIYNRQLRKNLFPYGLFHFEDSNGYIHLYIDKTDKKLETPLTTFTSKIEANQYLNRQCDKYALCQKLCGLYKTESSCFGYQVKSCKGACIQEENSEEYNRRVNQLIDFLSFENKNFYIIEEGRERKEKCLISIENGSYRGYGYVPFYVLKNPHTSWKKHIDTIQEDRDARTILNYFLRKHEELNIVYC